MKRQIIHIDESKCNGCGICADACHEGAIEVIDGKAKLVRENFCDGFGDCLPACPMEAISFEEREAPAYDKSAVDLAKNKAKENNNNPEINQCPGTRVQTFNHKENTINYEENTMVKKNQYQSQLGQWPCQIKLVPTAAPFFDGAKLLIAADCTAYAYADFHQEFMKGRITLIGCPKLDNIDYSEKLAEIIKNNEIKDVTILRMEVPCCGGLEYAATKALKESGKFIPWRVVTISIDGKIIE